MNSYDCHLDFSSRIMISQFSNV